MNKNKKEIQKASKDLFLLAPMVLILVVFVGLFYMGNGYDPITNSGGKDMPCFGSCDAIRTAFQETSENGSIYYGGLERGIMVDDMVMSAEAGSNDSQAPAPKASGDYSETNIQVEGVDEADIVKNDGEYLYIISTSQNTLFIVKAYPADEMKIVSQISFSDNEYEVYKSDSETQKRFYATELFISDNSLLLFGNSYIEYNYGREVWAEDIEIDNRKISPPYYNTNLAVVQLYNIRDKSKPVLEKEYEFEGSHINSRKIGDKAFFVIRSYPDYWALENNEEITPYYRINVKGEEGDFEKIAKLARRYGVNLQIHVAESEFENDYCLKKFGKRPVAFLQSIGWKGSSVSYVHCIYLNKEEIKVLAKSKSNVVHCPISNARGEGIAPITELLEKGVNIGIGVDGSASNDSSNILEEMRWARILQGARKGFTYLKPSEVLEIGTLGGAKALNRDDIGSIEEGKAADIAIFDTRRKISHAGAVCDPVGSLIASQAIPAEYVVVNGKVVVENGIIKTIDLVDVIQQQNKWAKQIIKKVIKN